jgi:hypothetical protein
MRRALVLTDEAARHPFLAGLAPHVRAADSSVPPLFEWRLTAQDVKEFLLAYCACFVAASAFIA